jgi:hypothetical protein
MITSIQLVNIDRVKYYLQTFNHTEVKVKKINRIIRLYVGIRNLHESNASV